MVSYKWGKFSKKSVRKYRLIREKTLNIGRKDFQGGYENYTFDEDTGEVGYTGQFGLLRRFYHIPYEDYHKDQGYVLIEYDLTKLRAPYIDYENFVKGTTYGHKKESYYIDVKGSRVDTVTSTNRNAYPNDGESGSYWYVYEGISNQAPTISGKDENLGGKTSPFAKSFTVNDSDTGQSLEVKVKLNGVQISSISNATRGQDYTVDIDQKTFDSLDVGKVNTIEISVNDGQGATSVRRWTFTRTNSNPIVKMANTNLGEQNKTFDINFNAIDPDGDPITSKVFVDDIQVMDLGGINPGDISKKLSKVDFAKIKNGSHKLRVEVTDDKGAKGFGYSGFSKNLTYAWYKLIKEVDSEPAEVIVQNLLEPAGGAEGTIISIKVCNNALDSSPTWEEVPKDLQGQRYNFKNSSKTADKWAVGVWVRIDRGTAKTDTSWFGFVGAYA